MLLDYIRRLVSGPRARFQDDELNLDLDLVYVTDRIIIMGYPAIGLEGYYRNRREDVKKFLDHRHKKNYWVFNFCPLGENSYDSRVFEGRVSRFPFPDHHAPPLAIMPLLAREVRTWLNGSPDRVAVLHCKAGKGRSGTMACTYLLSLNEDPVPQKLLCNHTAEECAKICAQETMNALPEEQVLDRIHAVSSPLLQASFSDSSVSDASNNLAMEELGRSFIRSPGSISATADYTERCFTEALKGVLDLHTARRMKPLPDPSKKPKQGVSIPSQRRFLHYWSLCLAHQAPLGFWSLSSPPTHPPSPDSLGITSRGTRKYVRLTEIKLRLCELSPIKLALVKAAKIIMDQTKGKHPPTAASMPVSSEQGFSTASSDHADQVQDNGAYHVWASLARYDDEFVNTLEQWEQHTRDESGKMGIRRRDSHRRGNEGVEDCLTRLFEDGRWDENRMIRNFARFGEATRSTSQGIDQAEKISTYTLQSLSSACWESIKHDIQSNSRKEAELVDMDAYDLLVDEKQALSDTESIPLTSVTCSDASNISFQDSEQGVILDAEREVRIKLFMGRVFMGWIWLIPAFHMPHTSPAENGTGDGVVPRPIAIRLKRKEVDFPIGLGTGIVDVELSLESITPKTSSQREKP